MKNNKKILTAILWIVVTLVFVGGQISTTIFCTLISLVIAGSKVDNGDMAVTTPSSTEDVLCSTENTNEYSWENELEQLGFLEVEDNKNILLEYIPTMNECIKVELRGNASCMLTMKGGSTYYISLYFAGKNIGKIASITTTESDYNQRTKLYPIEEDIVYNNIDFEEMIEDWWTDTNINKEKYLNKYVECVIPYAYDFHPSMTNIGCYTIYPFQNDFEYKIQIKFVGDALKDITNVELGLEDIKIRGEVMVFDEYTIIIKCSEVIK